MCSTIRRRVGSAPRRAIGIEQFEYNPADEQWGFASWNDFFTRPFRDGQRPVASPDDDKIIVNACESTPYRLAIGVKRQDRFWIKSQPYSLQDMLANDDAVDQFVGGTVYQAYLSALNYRFCGIGPQPIPAAPVTTMTSCPNWARRVQSTPGRNSDAAGSARGSEAHAAAGVGLTARRSFYWESAGPCCERVRNRQTSTNSPSQVSAGAKAGLEAGAGRR